MGEVTGCRLDFFLVDYLARILVLSQTSKLCMAQMVDLPYMWRHNTHIGDWLMGTQQFYMSFSSSVGYCLMNVLSTLTGLTLSSTKLFMVLRSGDTVIFVTETTFSPSL